MDIKHHHVFRLLGASSLSWAGPRGGGRGPLLWNLLVTILVATAVLGVVYLTLVLHYREQ